MAQDRWDALAAIMRALDEAGVLDAAKDPKVKATLADLAAARTAAPEDRWGWTSKDGARLSVIRTRSGVLVDLNNHAFALPDNAVTSLMGWLAS